MAKLHSKFGIPTILQRPWDDFWVNAWRDAGSDIYFTESSSMTPISGVENLNGQEFHDAIIARYVDGFDVPNYPTSAYCAGKDIVRKNVLELGAGCGWLGKQLALHANNYLGLDYSKLAVAIGNAVSSDNAHYETFSGHNVIEQTDSKFDTVITCNLLIHANYSAALAFTKLAHWALKPGGVFYAAFFRARPELDGGSYKFARADMALDALTCGYDYTRYDIQEIAQKAKFEIIEMQSEPEKMRTYTALKKI